MNLYEIREDMMGLLSQVDDDGLITEQAFEQIEQLQIAEGEKLEAIGCLIKNWRAENAALKAEAKALRDRATAVQNRIDRLSSYVRDYLVMTDKRKVVTTRAVLSLRKSTSVDIVDESLIHDDYWKVTRSVSKADIGKFLKAGVPVSGAVLVENENLQIK